MDYGMQMVELEKLFSNKIQKIVSNHYKNQFYCWNKRKRILIQEAFYFLPFLPFPKMRSNRSGRSKSKWWKSFCGFVRWKVLESSNKTSSVKFYSSCMELSIQLNHIIVYRLGCHWKISIRTFFFRFGASRSILS